MRLWPNLVTMLAVASGACAAEDPSNTIRIGLVLGSTGPHAERGLAQLNAARLAAEQINQAGGVDGKDIRLVARNDGSDPSRVEQLVEGLLAEQIAPLIIGATQSAITGRIAEVLGTRAFLLSGSATGVDASLGVDGLFHCLCGTDRQTGRFLAELAVVNGFRKVAVLGPDAEAERELADAFIERAVELKIKVAYVNRYRPGREEYGDLLSRLTDIEPQAILLDAQVTDAALIINTYEDLFFDSSVSWLLSEDLAIVGFLAAIGGELALPHIGVMPARGPRYAGFREAYVERYGESPARGAYSAAVYDAVFLAALAMATTDHSQDPLAIAEALAEVAAGGHSFGAEEFVLALKALESGDDIDFVGASGQVSMPGGGHEESALDLWAIHSGRITQVDE